MRGTRGTFAPPPILLPPVECFCCGDICEPTPGGIGVGYGMEDGRPFCYSCGDERERGRMAAASSFCAYLSGDGKSVTTWPGGELARVVRLTESKRAGFGHGLAYVSAVTPSGVRWYGKGAGRGMFLRLHRGGVAK